MEYKKEDLRIKKTKASLYRALVKLLSDKDFDKISISKICSLSSINRSTFYDHFNDKYELLISFIDDLKLELISRMDYVNDYYGVLDNSSILLDYFDSKIKIFYSLINSKYDYLIKTLIYNSMYSKCNSKDINYVFMIGGISSLITYYLTTSNFDKDYIYLLIKDFIIKNKEI